MRNYINTHKWTRIILLILYIPFLLIVSILIGISDFIADIAIEWDDIRELKWF